MAQKKKDEGDTPYNDVSSEAEAAAAPEFDGEGNQDAKSAKASATVEAEQSRRAAGAAEGGGPWPKQFMRRFFDPIGSFTDK